jgi:PAS domain S-box-containing protein
MDISEQIASQWAARQKEFEVVWWLLPRIQQEAVDEDVTAKLQNRITACLLMTPFHAESGQQVGLALAQQFGFHLEKLGQLQQLLAEQLFRGLNETQMAWLAPRLIAFWSAMTVGYSQVLQQLYAEEQAAQQQKLLAEFQRLTEQATESEERFEALFMASAQPVFLHENGRILTINHAVTQQFGYTAEDLVGQTVQSLIQTMALPAEQAKILKRMENGQERPYHTQCLSKEGTAVAVAAAARYVNYRGRTVRMVVLSPLDEAFPSLPDPEEVDLTPRQEAILHQMAAGLTDKEIAEKLDISLATVNHHKGEIFEKLQVNTRAKAIAWVWQKLPPSLEG